MNTMHTKRFEYVKPVDPAARATPFVVVFFQNVKEFEI
jgi:hypothetical protein